MNAIVAHILEADDDFPIKDLTEPKPEPAGEVTVKGYKLGRMKLVDMPGYTFLISFLTPVAYFDKDLGSYFETSKQWSPTTNRHIQEWRGMIYKSPEYQNDPKNVEQGEPTAWNPTGRSIHYPRFNPVRQRVISDLFRKLIPTMIMKPHMKRRLYRVDPRMRRGNTADAGQWNSGHLKHHDTGEEGLPRPGDPGFGEFFKDFDPDEPDYFDWGSGIRDTEPYERDEPKR